MRQLFAFLSAFLIVAGLPLSAVPTAGAIVASHQRTSVVRLPKDVRPELYDIVIKPNLSTGTFSGRETVTFRVSTPAANIKMHSLELQLGGTSVIDEQGKAHTLRAALAPAQELVTFNLPNGAQFKPGLYKLRTTFSGKISNKLVGLYNANFVDRNGKKQLMAATQFEPADARRMFPCFDEPELKARFRLAVQIDPRFAAVSNAAVEKDSVASSVRTVQFTTTEPMSSYLLALVVGELEASPVQVVEGIPIRVWSAKGMSNLGVYAREQAAKLLPFLNNYFGIPYPWKKLDLIAVPEFAAGAMENPGAITFRESLLLLDPKNSATDSLKGATSVIAHEMAHLWFGDLVTMKWWDDLWLNEAFATWMATKAVDAIHPEWDMWKGYAYDRIAGMDTDSLTSTRAIHADVGSPSETHEMFDAITYEKGASVLRMLERHVGDPVFQKGVHMYLDAHQFGNATTKDLWDAVGKVSGTPVAEMMQGWVHQPGYPLLRVAMSANRGGVAMEQSRFLLAPGRLTPAEKWMVPVGIRSMNHSVNQSATTVADRKFLLTETKGESPVQTGPPLICNAGSVGYYRVMYSDPMFASLLTQPLTNFDPAERLALWDDSSNLTLAGLTPIQRHLNLAIRFRNETDDAVWAGILDDISYWDRFVEPAIRPAFQRFVQFELADIYDSLGWTAKTTDSPQTRSLRGRIIATLGTLGQDKQVIAQSRRKFAEYLKKKSSLDPDLIESVSQVIAYNGGVADYDQFLHLTKTAATPEERVRNLGVLVNFQSPQLAARTLASALSPQTRLQDSPRLIGGLLSRWQTQNQAWQFVTANWQQVRARFPEDMVPHVVASASAMTFAPQLSEMKTFFAAHPVPSGKRTTARALERAGINVEFRKRSAADLNKWLQTHYGV